MFTELATEIGFVVHPYLLAEKAKALAMVKEIHSQSNCSAGVRTIQQLETYT